MFQQFELLNHQRYSKLWENDVLPLLKKLQAVKDINDVWPLLNSIASVTSQVKLNKFQLGSTFDGLHAYYNLLNTNEERNKFLSTIKIISSYAKKIQEKPQNGMVIYLSYKNQPYEAEVDRQLIACLLAHSFLCLHPTINRPKEFPEVNFTDIYKNFKLNVEKITCLLKYFEQLSANNNTKFNKLANKKIVFFRGITTSKHINKGLLKTSKTKLCKLQVDHKQLIEDTDKKYARVDFANMYLGGGVLNTGCVQEEILFTVCPELIAGMLIMQSMKDNEAIAISGFEQFCSYKGYGRTFKYTGDYFEQEGAENCVIAIDAIDYRKQNTCIQFEEESMIREITKAFTGFHSGKILSSRSSSYDQQHVISANNHMITTDKQYAIATGNWGCGAFKGDPVLKSLLQWIAASEAKCDEALYCTFNHKDLADFKAFAKIWQYALNREVGELVDILFKMAEENPGEITYDNLIRALNAKFFPKYRASIV